MFLYDAKEELQLLQQSYLIVPFLIKTIKHLLYGTAISNSKQAVKRNLKRFPPDFMFQLTNEETAMQLELINQSLAELQMK